MEFDKVFTHKVDSEHSLSLVNNWKISNLNKQKVKNFIKDYSIGKITGKIGNNSPASIERNLSSLKVGLENLKEYTQKDINKFLDDLIHDKLKTKRKKNFSIKSKKSIINILYKFLRWDKKEDIAKVLDIEIKEKPKDPPSLTEEEIEKLYNAVENPKYQYFISVLYSTGARAEEFHNIRFSDISMPDKEKGEEYVKITLRKEYSKTKGRTISLYWKYALPSIKRYLNQRIKEGIKPNEPVFPLKYTSMKDWLNRLSQKVLQKNVNYHLFRHSRATHLATKMNRQQLCIYFGWAFSSSMPDIYIDRSGIELQEIDNRFNKTKNEELEQRIQSQQEELDSFREKFKIMDAVLDMVMSGKALTEEQMIKKYGKKAIDNMIETERIEIKYSI